MIGRMVCGALAASLALWAGCAVVGMRYGWGWGIACFLMPPMAGALALFGVPRILERWRGEG